MAALKDASTGYDTVADFFDSGPLDSFDSGSSLEALRTSTVLFDHTSGYASVADFTDPGPLDFFTGNSESSLEDPYSTPNPQGIDWELGTGAGSRERWGVVGT